ncbi:hypothetical protein PSAC2689_10017 [Paraburkholderia sacchari]
MPGRTRFPEQESVNRPRQLFADKNNQFSARAFAARPRLRTLASINPFGKETTCRPIPTART